MEVNAVSKPAGQFSSPAARQWGSREWFSHLLRSQGQVDTSAYFALSGYHRHRHRRIVSFLKTSNLLTAREAFLDVGCGTGHLASLVKKNFHFQRSVGIDFVPDLIDAVRVQYPDVSFALASLPKLEYADNSFNLVIAAEVLYYLSHEDRRTALKEIHRVLKPGGILLFTSAIGPRYFTPCSAQTLLRERFEIAATSLDFHRLYHLTIGRLSMASRLHQLVSNQEVPGTEDSQRRFERIQWMTQLPGCQTTLAFLSHLANPILKAQWIPHVFNSACTRVSPESAASNVNIIARKEIS